MVAVAWLKQSIITVLCVLGIPSYLSAPKPISIFLEGQSAITVPANRAVISLRVYSEGPKQEKVADEVRKTADEIMGLLRPLSQPPDMDRSSTGSTGTAVEEAAVVDLSVNTFRSYSSQKPTLLGQAPVFDASVEIEAEFRDFDALGILLAQVSKTPKVGVQSLKWTLDEQTRKRLFFQCREQATLDALEKVRAYIRPFGMDKVRAIKLTESYRRSHDVVFAHVPSIQAHRQAADMVHDEMEAHGEDKPEAFGLEPRTLEIAAEIDGQFCAWKTGLEAWFRRGGV